ncbi:aldehyde oxidase and xanthine dehydrogenase, a/b hammerhead domain protein [Oesophagostomum dentatum]|uniref:Aldehyde oxidase and xanthine dehydrogenase, a/b hammerhead domain protein n=1 Tax=Oesophagostomum dentatum TaxID=61180 RepID=A0A0B1SJZ7_OESDE|nr:aldehyde oxidase and xanthine dehydrogenase, a/b hammerhead domain protein [Oesophagostomum dentatum]
MSFVLSPVSCGRLESVDVSAALVMDGVVAYIDATDVIQGAKIGSACDTPIFVDDKISYYGQPIAAIVAIDHETAWRAAGAVRVKCSENVPVLTIEKIAMWYIVIWSKYDRVVEGEIRIGGQEHFYLETQQCIVVPLEDDELIVHVSAQGTKGIQEELTKCLGIPAHKIVVKVARVGGGFGGKENAPELIAVPTAIAARKLRRPVRFSLERFDDMVISGTRHPFRFDYKVALDLSGKFRDYKVSAYSNCGHTLDLSAGVTRTRYLV